MTMDGTRRFSPDGALVIETVPRWLSALDAQLTRGARVEADFSGVSDIDSSVLALMLHWRRKAEEAGAHLAFVQVPANLGVLAELYGMTFLLEGPGTSGAAA